MPPASHNGVVVRRPPARAEAAGARVVRVHGRGVSSSVGVMIMMMVTLRACLHGAARLDLGRRLDGARIGVGAADAGHEGWASGSGLDELVAAAEETHD